MSPFKSKAQMKYLFKNEPVIAERWAKESPVKYSKLPVHVKKKVKTKKKKR